MDRSATLSLLLASVAGLALTGPVAAHGQQRPPQEIILRQGLVVGRIGGQGRAAVHVDPVEAQIVAGKWSAPKAGDGLTLPGGAERKWEVVTAGKEDWLQSPALSGGYCYFSVPSSVQRVM